MRFPLLLLVKAGAILASLPVAPATELERVQQETLRSFTGESIRGVDTRSLTGKVMCGYQGWFHTETDGAGRGWDHWTSDGRKPSAANIRVDMWPDVSELAPEERDATELRHRDGRTAELFSSFREPTVRRHFRWMREYGIDGAFVQRFGAGLKNPRVFRSRTAVLGHCRTAANAEGRGYAVMYDLSGMGEGKIAEVRDDWALLRARMKITDDPAYMHHRGKPLVAVWGIGFGDNRRYTLAECRELIEFLKADDCAVMVGVPTHWRELKGDAAPDPALHEVIRLADVVSPWTVGRFGDEPGIQRHESKFLRPDSQWCRQTGLDYLPVIFPGFSWRNMNRATKPPFDHIPRRGGQFMWSQILAAKRAGADMLYVAMFDEVDEATAVFKVASDTPDDGDVRFVSDAAIPSDHYLRITGAAGRLLRGELPPVEAVDRALEMRSGELLPR
jgi:hypothetical protein